jgi:hypothetical protein
VAAEVVVVAEVDQIDEGMGVDRGVFSFFLCMCGLPTLKFCIQISCLIVVITLYHSTVSVHM